MTQQVNAIFEHGVLKPLGPLTLREQEIVSLSIQSATEVPGNGAEPTLYDLLDKAGLIGCIKDAPPDLSSNPKYMEGFGKGGS